jgi:DNA polymerase
MPIDDQNQMTLHETKAAARALLEWYVDQGVDEAVGATALNAFEETPAAAPQQVVESRPTAKPPTRTVTPIAATTAAPPDEAAARAADLAKACRNIAELAEAVAAFDGCPLRAGARNTVFIDGALTGDLLVIGEAPGRDEDRIGKPFVGRAGQVLDRMLAAIGRSRENDTMITNVVFWRPPGNRTPTQTEVMVCRPFVDRLIELVKPKALMLAGGAPTQALTGASGIMRTRGAWRDVTTAGGMTIPAMPLFHPAFLLRQSAQKRLAWQDLQSLAKRLRDG